MFYATNPCLATRQRLYQNPSYHLASTPKPFAPFRVYPLHFACRCHRWVRAYDPISIIGGMDWSSYSVEVAASFGDTAQTLLDDSGTPLRVTTCDVKDDAQVFTVNIPATGYLRNDLSTACLNVIGCGKNSDVIVYPCLVSALPLTGL